MAWKDMNFDNYGWPLLFISLSAISLFTLPPLLNVYALPYTGTIDPSILQSYKITALACGIASIPEIIIAILNTLSEMKRKKNGENIIKTQPFYFCTGYTVVACSYLMMGYGYPPIHLDPLHNRPIFTLRMVEWVIIVPFIVIETGRCLFNAPTSKIATAVIGIV